MKITVIGGLGNMGRRYVAILKHLGVDVVVVDVDFGSLYAETDGYIIATPTETHGKILRELIPLGKPIICEKPVSKDMGELRFLCSYAKEFGTPLDMIMQYRELINPDSVGPSYYRNWNHGKDGLVWDCMQIICLSEGEITLSEESPEWKCMINGHELSIADMDEAYIKHISKWLINPVNRCDYILEQHMRVDNIVRSRNEY